MGYPGGVAIGKETESNARVARVSQVEETWDDRQGLMERKVGFNENLRCPVQYEYDKGNQKIRQSAHSTSNQSSDRPR